MKDIIELLKVQGRAFEEFKTAQDRRVKNLEDELLELAKKSNRLPAPGFGSMREDDEHKTAFMSYLRSGQTKALDSLRESKSLISGSDPDGGYLIPKQIDSLITKALRELSPMRQLARVVLAETADYSMVHSTGGTGYAWVGETESRPQTATPKFQEIKPPMGEIYSMPPITQRLLDDAGFDLENWLIEELTESFDAGEGAAFIIGDGLEKPRGLLTYDIASTADGVRSESEVQYVASGAAGDFATSYPADKLVKLVHALKPRYRNGASWLMNTNTLEAVRIMKDGQNNYIWRAGIEADKPGTLLGYPVYEDENMPEIGANSLSIAFGNFQRAYTIVDRNTLMLRDPFTAKPYVLFYTSRRVGGAIRDFRAVKLMKFASN